MDSLEKYRPLPSWFAHNPYGIHGIGHAARVFVWVNMIGRELQASGTVLDLEALRWAAVVHDVGRLDDGIDKGHGLRSIDWFKANLSTLPVPLPGDSSSPLSRIDRIIACCRWHEIADDKISRMTPEIMCIKDADGLDRVRINDLNPAYLRTEAARLLVDDAWDLFGATKPRGEPQTGAEDPWEEVLRAAGDRGWL